ncbi:hypothetical protein A6A27_31870 [Micromonospora sp. CB01531]|nr:hypothetical protein A6A27_31870 [Micromonospora sp. CB01531]
MGDLAHQATDSDHNPDPDGSVDAWDMDVDGVDVQAVIAAALKHEAIQYVIYNRRITSRSWGLGVWRTYSGKNPHDKHVHFSTRDSHENSTKPWFPEEDLVTTQAEFNDFFKNALKDPDVAKELRRLPWQYEGGGIPAGLSTLNVLNKTFEGATSKTVLQPVTIDKDQLAALLQDPAFLAGLAKAVNDDAAKRMQA